MVASHNQASIEHTVAGLAARGLAPSGSGVYFGQLLGMADNLTFTLGQHGYDAFKYVPYGEWPRNLGRAHRGFWGTQEDEQAGITRAYTHLAKYFG